MRIEPSKMVVDILPFFGGRKAVTVGRKGLMKEGKTKQGKKSRITTQSNKAIILKKTKPKPPHF